MSSNSHRLFGLYSWRFRANCCPSTSERDNSEDKPVHDSLTANFVASDGFTNGTGSQSSVKRKWEPTLLGAGRQVARQFLTLTAASLHRYLQTLNMASACVTYTGTGSAATVGHGLNKVPQLIISKGETSANDLVMFMQQIHRIGATCKNSN